MKTQSPIILRIAVPTPLRRAFDYLAPSACALIDVRPGMRVRVPFQHRELVGVLLEVVAQPDCKLSKLKQAIEILDDKPIITDEILNLCHWAATYYHHPIGDVLDTALPTLLRQGKTAVLSTEWNVRLTDLGKSIELSTLKRSPKQKAFLEWLAHYPSGVGKRQIKEQKLASTILKTLRDKGWIENAKSDSLTYVPLHANAVEAALSLNDMQQKAVTTVRDQAGFNVFLLDGVTGSGKTEVYLHIIADVIQQGKQVLVLVPEIGLTPQTIARFRQRFSVPVIALHSGLSDKERLNAWLLATSGEAYVLIGTRSAIFTPFKQLGVIIVDEEHDLSFKQQEGFRYHARDLAIMRAQALQINIVLGSATPSLETLCRMQQGKYHHLLLPFRAGFASPPTFLVQDIRNQYLEEGLSEALLKAMHEHLQNGNQVMLFLNRRGFAPVYMCHACGWIAMCKRCDTRMTFHHEARRLHCHHCDSRKLAPKNCEQCHVTDLQIIGLGTERLEHALLKHFPDYSIARIDKDSTQRKGSMENLLEKIQTGEHRILIGTQMLAKGHHFPDVTLVGIIDADSGFFSSDFRAIERMGQLVLQVAGRAGRVSKPGTVMLQTHHPDHPLVHQLLRETYHHFATSLLQERQQALLPPYGFLALFRAEAHSFEQAQQFLAQIKQLADKHSKQLSIWGPVPAPMPRRAGRFRVQLLFQANQRSVLHHYLSYLLPQIEKLPSKNTVRWSLDVDPLEMS